MKNYCGHFGQVLQFYSAPLAQLPTALDIVGLLLETPSDNRGEVLP